MKKKLALSIFMICIFLLAQPVFAATEYTLVNESGSKQAVENSVELADSVDAGRIRIVQNYESLGLLEEGDKIIVTLRNATFNKPPVLENPAKTSINLEASTGKYWLQALNSNVQAGTNSVTYQLVKKTEEEHTSNYDNLDYVFHFSDLRPNELGSIFVTFSGVTSTIISSDPLITNAEVVLADVVKKNTIGISEKSYSEEHMERAVDIQPLMINQEYYTIKNREVDISLPRSFFTTGAMRDFYSEYRANNLKVVTTTYGNLEVTNPEFSKSLTNKIYQLEPFVYLRTNKTDSLIEAGSHYQGVKLSMYPGEITLASSYQLVPVKYVRQDDGSYKKEFVSSGTYNPATKQYSFEIPGPGFYGVEQKDLTRISLKIGDTIMKKNNDTIFLDVPPQIINNLTYLPLRSISEAFGAEVEFLEAERKVTIKTDQKLISLSLDDGSAKIVNGRTLVPVRYIAEEFGSFVYYSAENQKVDILK